MYTYMVYLWINLFTKVCIMFRKKYTWPLNQPAPAYERVFFEDATYEQITRGMVIPCSDVLPYMTNPGRLILAQRSIMPMQGWWHFGGRVLMGETGEEAAIRHFKRDVGTSLSPKRLSFIGTHDYQWHDRAQAPHDVPCHSKSDTFAVEITADEMASIAANLRPSEYVPGSLTTMDWSRLQGDDIHPVLRDAYVDLFGRPGDYCI